MTETAPKVAISIPYYRSVEGATLLSCMGLMGRSVFKCGIFTVGTSGCYIEDNRNGCVEFHLNTGIDFDWMLWIDSDMAFPDDALLRLLAHDKDIVGVNYRQRIPPHSFVGQYLDGSDTHILKPGLHPMSHLGFGFVLMRFDIFRKMAYPWFAPGLKTEPRDDVYFCRRAVAEGYKIWCDHDLTREVAHDGVPWFTEDQVRVVEGGQLNIVRAAEEAKERARVAALPPEGYKAASAA